MITVNKLFKTKRKNLTISIDGNGDLVVKAPLKLSNNEIEKFLLKKQSWIEIHQKRILFKNNLYADFYSYKKVLFCGKLYFVSFHNKKEIALENNFLYVPQTNDQIKIVKKIEKFLKEENKSIIKNRLLYFTNLMQLEPNLIKISNAKKRWGTCDNKDNLSFNWRMICLPPRLIDYIIVHELSHIMELNHSPKFWAIVNSILPDFKDLRKELKECDFILKLFRYDQAE